MSTLSANFSSISCTYPNEAVRKESELIFTIKPSVACGVDSLLQFDLSVTQEAETLPLKIAMTSPRGMDETEIIKFTKLIKTTAKPLRKARTEVALEALI